MDQSTRGLFGPMALLVGALALIASLQLTWFVVARSVVLPSDTASVPGLALLHPRLDGVVAAVDMAWVGDDPRIALPQVAALTRELQRLEGATDIRHLAPTVRDVVTRLEALLELLRRGDLDGGRYSEARSLLAGLEGAVALLVERAQATTTGQLRRLHFGMGLVAVLSAAGLVAAAVASYMLISSSRRLVRRHARRTRSMAAAASRARHEAEHDPLTGIGNRRRFEREIGQRIDVAFRSGRRFALHLLDIDGLKRINDTLGHGAGDLVLRSAAEALQRSVRTEDCVARLGGDEFVVIQAAVDGASATALARRIAAEVGAPVPVGDERTITTTASVGTAIFGIDGVTADALLQVADTALYSSKQDGAGNRRPTRLKAVSSTAPA